MEARITNTMQADLPDRNPIHLYDTETGAHILSIDYLPLPTKIGRQFMLDMSADGHRIVHLCQIDKIDTATRQVLVTLNKIYLDDVKIYPPATKPERATPAEETNAESATESES